MVSASAGIGAEPVSNLSNLPNLTGGVSSDGMSEGLASAGSQSCYRRTAWPRRDASVVAVPLDAPFQQIAHTEFAGDLLGIHWPILLGEGAVARDYEHASDPRQISGEVLGNSVPEVLLIGVVAEIGEGQHDNRRAWAAWGAPIEVVAVAALTAGAVEVVLEQPTHQAIMAMASTVATVAAIGGTMLRLRCAEIGTSRIGTASGIGIAAMVSGRNAKARTGRAIFLTLCSPLSSKA